MPHDDEDWNSYRRLVMESLTSLRDECSKLSERVRSLELQAAKYGLIAGTVASLVGELIKYALHKP